VTVFNCILEPEAKPETLVQRFKRLWPFMLIAIAVALALEWMKY
jgi:hypothetical protein